MKHLWIYLLMAMLAACETPSDITIESEHRTLVLTSYLYADSAATVSFYRAAGYSDTIGYEAVPDAEIFLAVNGEAKQSLTLAEGELKATFDVRPQTGDIVTIIATDGEHQVCGRTTLLEPCPIVRVDTVQTSPERAGRYIDMFILMRDDAATTDFYQLVVNQVDTLTGNTRRIDCLYTDYLFGSVVAPTISSVVAESGFFVDERINGRWCVVSFSVSREHLFAYGETDVLQVVLHRHTSEYFYFETSVLQASEYLLLPVFGFADISSNVQGGIGVVSGMAFDSKLITVRR